VPLTGGEEGFVGTGAFSLCKLQILSGRRHPVWYDCWKVSPAVAGWDPRGITSWLTRTLQSKAEVYRTGAPHVRRTRWVWPAFFVSIDAPGLRKLSNLKQSEEFAGLAHFVLGSFQNYL
jgi:hypothetical protein